MTIAEKLHNTLLFAAPELHLWHIQQAFNEAVEEERQRCLKIANSFSDESERDTTAEYIALRIQGISQ